MWPSVVRQACEVSKMDRAGRLINELIEETYLSAADLKTCDRIWNKLLDYRNLFMCTVHEAARHLGLRTEF
jgi:hypothetical protein